MKGKLRLALILLGMLVLASHSLHAQWVTKANLNRPYDPIVLKCSQFPQFVDSLIAHIRVMVYHDTSNAWEPIPFQIDPRTAKGSYFGYKTGYLTSRDELVLLTKDLGDRVPDSSWPQADTLRLLPRYEIEVQDSANPDQKAWAYVYLTPDLPLSSIDYIQYDSTKDQISSSAYQLGFSPENGLPNQIIIPQATVHPDTNFFERFKFRFKVYAKKKFLWTWVTREIVLSEMDLERVPNDKYVDGPIRVIYPLSVKININTGFSGVPPIQQGPYSLPMTFYPNSLQLDARGLDIKLDDLPYGIQAKLKLIRFSLDFNAYASGMQYFSKYNKDVPVDGIPDSDFNYALDPGKLNYFMLRGGQGSLVSIDYIPTIGSVQQPYYWDKISPLNTTQDHTADTGDKRSYGDSGFLITGENITGKTNILHYTYFFPPDADTSLGKELVNDLSDPLEIQIAPHRYDGIPPAPVQLTVMSVDDSTATLSWVAPGDDSTSGQAYAYDLRYSVFSPTFVHNPMIVYNYASVKITGEPVPAPAGQIQSMTVTGLEPTKTYYFMMTTLDESGNRSALSNIAQATLLDVELSGFSARVTPAGVHLSWKTTSERNNYGFEINRKQGGSFEKIGFIRGCGTTQVEKTYDFTDTTATAGHWVYRLKQIDLNGKTTVLGMVQVDVTLPTQFALHQNYPNPFNPETRIVYELPRATQVTLRVYNAIGQVVRTLVDTKQSAGTHAVFWKGKNDFGESVAAGLYFYELRAGDFHRIRKMVLMR